MACSNHNSRCLCRQVLRTHSLRTTLLVDNKAPILSRQRDQGRHNRQVPTPSRAPASRARIPSRTSTELSVAPTNLSYNHPTQRPYPSILSRRRHPLLLIVISPRLRHRWLNQQDRHRPMCHRDPLQCHCLRQARTHRSSRLTRQALGTPSVNLSRLRHQYQRFLLLWSSLWAKRTGRTLLHSSSLSQQAWTAP